MDKRIKNYIGKPIVNLAGEKLGVIANVTCDNKFANIKNFVVYSDDEEEMLLPVKCLFSAGEDIVLIKNIIKVKSVGITSPLGLPAYDLSGKLIGAVSDIVLESDHKTVVGFECDGRIIPYDDLFSVGAFALFNTQHIEVKKPTRRKVYEMNENEDIFAENGEEKDFSDSLNDIIAKKEPKTTVSGEKMLIGRKIKKDLFLPDGTTLIRSGESVTRAVVEKAVKNGKLYELTVSSLSNIL